MDTLADDSLSDKTRAELRDLATSSDNDEVREFLSAVLKKLKQGDEIVAVSPKEAWSPSRAAEFLGMSRTHLYKLLDRGILPHHRVGKHRRVYLKDVLEFAEERDNDRRELAERFASQDMTLKGAIDEVASLV